MMDAVVINRTLAQLGKELRAAFKQEIKPLDIELDDDLNLCLRFDIYSPCVVLSFAGDPVKNNAELQAFHFFFEGNAYRDHNIRKAVESIVEYMMEQCTTTLLICEECGWILAEDWNGDPDCENEACANWMFS